MLTIERALVLVILIVLLVWLLSLANRSGAFG